MALRLIKLAKELNVATTTIVEYLDSKGFTIENKPTAKVSDEMHDVLLKEFSSSIAEKEKADKLVIGRNTPKKEVETPTPPKTPVVEKTTTSPPIKKVEPIVPKQEVKKPVVEVKKEPIIKPLENDGVKGLKVIGKIDLDARKKKEELARKEREEKRKLEKEQARLAEQKKKEERIARQKQEQEEKRKAEEKEAQNKSKKPETTTVTKKENKSTGSELIRAKTPQLKGLKILGKVDTSKLGGKPKKKKSDTPAAKTGQSGSKPNSGGNTNDSKSKRRRTRRKVNASQYNNKDNKRPRNRRNQKEEVKEVSQKEIDEKIKATMAKMGRGGKNKRQKIRRESREEKREKQEIRENEGVTEAIELTEFISVSEFASLVDVSVSEVIMTCMNLGVIVSINQRLDAEIIELLAEEFEKEVKFISTEEEADTEDEIVDDPADLKPRAPIVTVMGHVDHGKTSLLDFVRNASVAEGEAGGITQHIGAYEVKVGESKQAITFLDTPGHEAFTAMRARGAKVTDIAIIIIAADDRIMPQTKEAISHAQAAGVPIVFAINKIDKPGADPDRIKSELSQMNLLIEEWGGKYQSQDISAKKGTGIDELLEKVLLEAELLELKANPDRQADGTVIEASLDKGRGYVTKVLVQNGTIKIGDAMVAGEHSGKVKAMFNERGKRVKSVGPSQPVLILGLSGAPQAGEKFKIHDSEQDARQVASRRAQINREQTNRASKRISLDEIGRRLALGTFKELNLIVKGDVDGSIEALSDSLIKLSVETVQVNVIHKAVGQIVESDVLLASASDAVIIGFNVRPSSNARTLAEREGVQVKTYSIIYEVIDEVKAAMEGMLEPTQEERVVGEIAVRETYKISKVGTIAGCLVTSGKVARNNKIRLIRDGIVVYPTKEGVSGEISSLKRFKDDVKEVRNNMECGLSIKNFNDIKVGDIIEAYEIVEIKQTL